MGDVASVHTRRWALALAGMGWTVRVFGPSAGSDPAYEIVSWTAKAGSANPVRRFSQLREMGTAVRGFQPDVVLVEYAAQGLRSSFLPKEIPICVTVWGDDVIDYPGVRRDAGVARATRSLLRRATAVTAASRYLMDHTQVRYGLDPARCHVVPFGVDVQRFTPAAEADDEGPCRVLFAKHLHPEYGLDVLLRATASTLDLCNCELRVVGAGDEDTYSRMARQLGIGNLVTFSGPAAHDEMPAILRESHVYVMPTRVPESFGVGAVEAMACGLPVVASRVGAIPEVVDDGVTGYLFPAGDADALASKIVDLCADRETARAMGARGRAEAVERFAWSDNVETMDRLLRGIANGSE